MSERGEEAERYPILIERASDSGYGAWCPDLPGCVALDDTMEECKREMREAIAFHIEGLRGEGEPMPEPSGAGVYIELSPA